MSSTPPPPGGGYGQPDYGQQPEQGHAAYGQQPGGYAADPYGAPQPGRPAQMPASVATALKLIWARIALSVLMAVLSIAMLDTLVDQAMKGQASGTEEDAVRTLTTAFIIAGVVIGVGVALLLLTFIKKGAGWARIVFTVLTALGLLFGLFGVVTDTERPVILTILTVVYLLLGAAALFFLWKKESNPWFGQAAH